MLNKTRVIELFERYAVLFGDTDGVPEYQAVNLFGEEAVVFAKRYSNAVAFAKRNFDGCCSGFGIGDFTAEYLTFKGFRIAATYVNVAEIRQAQEEPNRYSITPEGLYYLEGAEGKKKEPCTAATMQGKKKGIHIQDQDTAKRGKSQPPGGEMMRIKNELIPHGVNVDNHLSMIDTPETL